MSNKIKFVLWWICLSFAMFSCSENENRNVLVFPDKQLLVGKPDTILLKENLTPMGRVRQVVCMSDTAFLVTDGTHVVVYGRDGEQKYLIGGRGHAGNEYVSVGTMYVTSDYIYLWCDMTLQLLQFTHGGNFVGKYNGPQQAIQKMIVRQDKWVYYYIVGRDDILINVYSLPQGIKLKEAGVLENEDIMLFFHAQSGALALWNDQVFYMPPSRIELVRMDDDFEEEIVGTIEDRDFSCENVKMNLREEEDVDIQAIYNYLLKNGVVTGAYAEDSLLCVMTETCGSVLQCDSVHAANRGLNLFLLRRDCIPLCAYRMDYPLNMTCYWYYGKCLYLLVNDSDSNSYSILKYTLL